MRTLSVSLAERSYPIHIGSGVLTQAELILPHLKTRRVAIVTNEVVAPLYLASLQGALEQAGVQVHAVVLPDGEAHKDLTTLNLIYDQLLGTRCERSTTLIALGGGVIGDMTGFAAATYQRGVPFIQIPTTLLSQVDSSVGGKTAVNHPLGKNMIGAFYQPVRVVCDLDTLNTLPERELSAGLAEVIKYGPIYDLAFLDWIAANLPALRARDAAALAYAVQRSCEIKAEVVGQDERESGLRAILNFGHTFGHAIEAGLGYGAWLHGEAVGCGMVMAATLSQRLGLLSLEQVAQLKKLVEAAGLPSRAPVLDTVCNAERYLELMRVDKKAEAGEIKFVLVNGQGQAQVCGAPDALVAEVIEACCAA